MATAHLEILAYMRGMIAENNQLIAAARESIDATRRAIAAADSVLDRIWGLPSANGVLPKRES